MVVVEAEMVVEMERDLNYSSLTGLHKKLSRLTRYIGSRDLIRPCSF